MLLVECRRRLFPEKRTLPGAPADVSAFSCVAADNPHPSAGMLTGSPFARRRGHRFHVRINAVTSEESCRHAVVEAGAEGRVGFLRPR